MLENKNEKLRDIFGSKYSGAFCIFQIYGFLSSITRFLKRN
jgi:hypothetical protein